MNALVLLGPPGAGKGTVAEVLIGRGFRHISTGDLLREQIELKTPLGLEAKELMDRGQFVPDAAVVALIRGLFEASSKEQKFLLDGFPRTLVQAERLGEIIESIGGTLSGVILLECPDEVIIDRLSGRRTCKKCGSVYHVLHNPASQIEKCDIDGCELMQRPDDNRETIKKRLAVYAEETAPLISYYENKGLIHAVDASQSIEQVRSAVLERLG